MSIDRIEHAPPTKKQLEMIAKDFGWKLVKDKEKAVVEFFLRPDVQVQLKRLKQVKSDMTYYDVDLKEM